MPRLRDPADLNARLTGAPVARLATIRPDGTPRLVPITFAVVDGLICSAVDTVKPKASVRLARLDDVRRDPRVGILVDSYDEDWERLWWVRVDGVAVVVDAYPAAVVALRAKYPAYANAVLDGPLLVVTPSAWSGWSAG
ncbi:MAG: TIGR03668 family PPOX class F420-dependent oxidoreductase [Geodermatophilaceae bacterium]|nr:TIGR03668 family PPOX class F420-dependent oxidoreductase [Geodermatophilaceae bacterium]